MPPIAIGDIVKFRDAPHLEHAHGLVVSFRRQDYYEDYADEYGHYYYESLEGLCFEDRWGVLVEGRVRFFTRRFLKKQKVAK